MKSRCLYCYEPFDGATEYHEKCALDFFGSTTPPQVPYSFSEMAELAKEVVQSRLAVPGVQAKLSMAVVKNALANPSSRLTVVGALGGNFIFKPPSTDYPEMPQNEHLTMRIAQAFGIRVVPSSLVRLSSGELAYITKRVDRTAQGDKIHMLDMFQITEAFDKYKSSMERVGKALRAYSSNTQLDALFYFELALFSFLTGNNDMHLKNFSMIESATGWELAPGYDLLNVAILLPEDSEELALTLEGKKKKLKKAHFENFGKGLGLTDKQVQGVFSRMKKKKAIARAWLDKSFLTPDAKTAYQNLLESRYAQLELA